MKSNKILIMILIVLILALIAVVGVIVYKQAEYRAGELFYDSLRTGMLRGRDVC
ncbi:MAG: hypothetical protein IKU34_04510 [Clostridia bacterium]|nr:hypothetical protein [Clostridia bacterium]